jgi:hypothetical protein
MNNADVWKQSQEKLSGFYLHVSFYVAAGAQGGGGR